MKDIGNESLRVLSEIARNQISQSHGIRKLLLSIEFWFMNRGLRSLERKFGPEILDIRPSGLDDYIERRFPE